MPTLTIEERVAALEAEVAQLKQKQDAETLPPTNLPWWERIYGQFADSKEYEEAMRLGREYREALRPKDDEADVQ